VQRPEQGEHPCFRNGIWTNGRRLTKLGLLVAAGVVMANTGCGGGNQTTSTTHSPSVKATGNGCEIARGFLRAEKSRGVPAYAVEAEELVHEKCGAEERGSRVLAEARKTVPSEAAERKRQAERSREAADLREEASQRQRPEAERTPGTSQGSWAGLQYAVEKQGWNSREAADFVLQMTEEGLSAKRAQGTAAAAFVLEEHGYSHREAVQGAREAEATLEGAGR
jgi:hypothetical protein